MVREKRLPEESERCFFSKRWHYHSNAIVFEMWIVSQVKRADAARELFHCKEQRFESLLVNACICQI